MTHLAESHVEQAALDYLAQIGFETAWGPDLAPDGALPERADFRAVLLEGRLRQALEALNPSLPPEALEEALRRVRNLEGATLAARNRALHQMLVDGVQVEVRRADGQVRGETVRLLDDEHPANNAFLAVNQFSVAVEDPNAPYRHRRPDIVLFVNGLPLGVVELKNAADEKATLWPAFEQLQTYQAEIPALMQYSHALVVSDGLEARLGTLTAGAEWFKPWRTVSGESLAPPDRPELEVLLQGVFAPNRWLDLIRYFTVFEEDRGPLVKKIGGYHQFHAVNVAIQETLRAAARQQALRERGRYEVRPQPGGEPGDRRVGVIWHTQGSGKSLTMVFYAARVMQHPQMNNPTLVVLTDRNDLDDQLFDTFSRCRSLLRDLPLQAESRAHLRELLRNRQAGGIIFTTIQKFLPLEGGESEALSERENIVVIADEAHRSQYDFVDGYAYHLRQALPNASYIGFTGTPLELDDRDTRHVFGDYISIYDIQRAVEDKATVPIYYESCLARLGLDESLLAQLDEAFEEITEQEESERQGALKAQWAQLEAVVGAQSRLKLLAADIVQHFEERLKALDGKGLIVCMSRRICVALYEEIVKLRPEWHSDDDEAGAIKVVMTGAASDPSAWQRHVRPKQARERLAARLKDPSDPLKLVIVRDMWLTGFDAPPLHTMYIDKPMRGHTLMQAIARVNRVFRDKPGGLVVDYIGLGYDLKRALETYTQSGGLGKTAIDQAEAVALLQGAHEVCCQLFAGFDWSAWKGDSPAAKLSVLKGALEHILTVQDGKQRLFDAVARLTKAFALATPHPDALALSADVAFFQAVRNALVKKSPAQGRAAPELEQAIRQLVDRSISPDGIVDVLDLAGLKQENLNILSEAFLAEVRGLPHKNLAVEALRRLLADQIQTRFRTNVVQSRRFSQMLQESLQRYENRVVSAVEVIEELIQMGKEMQSAVQQGEALGLSEAERAFYDALAENESAREALGDENLCFMAQELVRLIRENASIDWTQRASARAKLRVLGKRLLRKYGYPPDKQEKATQTVLEQAEALTEAWV
ncbi:MAG: type I restriction endonuclease subunit R [Anaerolineales bacterium]